jgi:hypothetical protein
MQFVMLGDHFEGEHEWGCLGRTKRICHFLWTVQKKTSFGTAGAKIGAKISLETRDFFVSDVEYDTDKSTKGFRIVRTMNDYIITNSNVADFNYKINYSFFSSL